MSKALVWLADADAVGDADLARYRDWLGPGEQARHQRFVRAQRQRQFIVGRVLLRAALGRLLGVAPREIRFEEQVGKGPRLAAPVVKGLAPGFSIAHSGRWVACAVSAQTALGLDIEMMNPDRDLAALAAQTFCEADMARWNALPAARRVDGFYRQWSEKEARFKLGADIEGVCLALPHPELSVVLCSAVPLSPPRIELVALP